MSLQRTRGEKIFNVCNIVVLSVFLLLMIFPVLYVIKMSLETGPKGVNNLSLLPKVPSLVFYRMILQKANVTTSFWMSVRITVVGTVLSMVLEAMGAYTLSSRKLPGHTFFTYLLIVPMMFSGGIVPLYLVVKYVGLMNSFWSMIIPSCISGWNIILIRNYYWSVPESLRESARMDGASEFTVFLRILLPLAKPVLAAIGLFTMVGYWNSFYNALMFISTPAMYPFQLVLREMISLIQDMDKQMMQAGISMEQMANVDSQSVSSAMIVISILPVLIIYPFLQKYFVKGIMVGSLKG
jgi:putative aldouronate transport system permease protein